LWQLLALFPLLRALERREREGSNKERRELRVERETRARERDQMKRGES